MLNMKKLTENITDIFFDLDRTLWDFETNSKVALETIYREYELNKYIESFPIFYQQYQIENNKVWEQYYKKEITKKEVRILRFSNTLKTLDNSFCQLLSNQYIEISMSETALIPYAKEALIYLKKKYKLHIISNGFKEVQAKKIKNCGLNSFFETITTSEDAQAHKPSKKAFLFAISRANTQPQNTAMIGDDIITDVNGSKNSGMLSIYFNQKNNRQIHNADIEISSMALLKNLF